MTFVPITETEMRRVLDELRPDLWAYQSEWVAIFRVGDYAIKVYTSVKKGEWIKVVQDGRTKSARREGASAPSGEDAIRVCVVDASRGTSLGDAPGVTSLPIVVRTEGWDRRLRKRLAEARSTVERLQSFRKSAVRRRAETFPLDGAPADG